MGIFCQVLNWDQKLRELPCSQSRKHKPGCHLHLNGGWQVCCHGPGAAGPNAKHFCGDPHPCNPLLLIRMNSEAIWQQHHRQLLPGGFQANRTQEQACERTVQWQCSAYCALLARPQHGRFHPGVSATECGASCRHFARHLRHSAQIGQIALRLPLLQINLSSNSSRTRWGDEMQQGDSRQPDMGREDWKKRQISNSG